MYKSILVTFVSIIFLSACSSNRINRHRPVNHVTEKSYCIKNIRYKPITKYDYCAIGKATWYGTFENGCPTATGFIFNKNFMTAAHRTLPLPCVVEVTNLDSGKKIKVFVNDRGPFVNTSNRIIDLSARSARELGIVRQGVVDVKVRCLPYESMLASLYYGRKHYYSRYESKNKLTPNEHRYIKEKIIKDFSNNCESLRKSPNRYKSRPKKVKKVKKSIVNVLYNTQKAKISSKRKKKLKQILRKLRG